MASLGRPVVSFGAGWRHYAGTPSAVLAVWAVYVLAALALLPAIGAVPAGPDDYMRLLEVRDLIGGQAWFDVTQYRMDPPRGASMHWSRLVDLPFLILIPLVGETAAMALVPLLYLLPALFALRAIMLRLGLPTHAVLTGLALLPLFPLLPTNFAPMRIDHHTPQAVLGIVCAALLLHDTRRSAALCGVLAAAWLAISLEALPLVAAIAGLYGVRYWLRNERLLAWFLGALALAAPALSLATRPLADLSGPYCDILLPGHMASFAAAAAIAAALAFAPAQARPAGRLAGLAAIALVCLPLAALSLGSCLADPFAAMDPLLQKYWHGFIIEGLPVWKQPASVAAMLVWTIALVPAGWWAARRAGLREGQQGFRWTLLALLALAAGAYSLWLMRAGLVAQLLAVPFAAMLVSHYLPRARALPSALPRIAATLGVLALATPVAVSAALKPFDPLFSRHSLRTEALAKLGGEPCDYTRLAGLPAGRIFAPLDRGPEILATTPHSVVMAGYHRNQARMRDIVAAYTGDPRDAERLVRANRADYVIACTSGKDIAVFRTARGDNLANALAEGTAPPWLTEVPGFAGGSLRIYRVRP